MPDADNVCIAKSPSENSWDIQWHQLHPHGKQGKTREKYLSLVEMQIRSVLYRNAGNFRQCLWGSVASAFGVLGAWCTSQILSYQQISGVHTNLFWISSGNSHCFHRVFCIISYPSVAKVWPLKKAGPSPCPEFSHQDRSIPASPVGMNAPP